MLTKAMSFYVISLVSIVFLLFGIYSSYEGRLAPNPCKMTYTSFDKTLIPVKSGIVGPKLYKYTNYNNKKLNKQPVLFIPGHMGMVDQVRSFSSTMHNGDGYFQYFALDFQEASSAFHGSDVLIQAVYVNDALRQIQTLYEINMKQAKNKKELPRIQIVAHSLGGMVARASILLSNHPLPLGLDALKEGDCEVSDIIMMSSPNHKPPFSPDASVDVLYTAVNRAWAASLYNTSSQCLASTKRREDTITALPFVSQKN
mmetsp:Transcript_23374/g.22517  ORF Transcript_23374/g.22517 Transcript_23374/m.22517 type:complete len:257 (-) Transcript_23374:790-1560(-)